MLGRGEPRLLLIHGHGTGALRNALRSWLRELPEVEEFGPGEASEGGNGVTFVRLTH
jgi:DNA mismatch repair protein MutS2